MTTAAVDSPNVKRINLALQGGGSHGAFTWGVLDRLLEDGRLSIDGISATSAGAMNAAVAAQGLMSGGADAARTGLEAFWRRVSQMAGQSPIRQTWFDRVLGGYDLDFSPSYQIFDFMTRILSPYQLNPADISPLRELLVLVDDVSTTGATLEACARVLVAAGAAEVRTLTAARVSTRPLPGHQR